VRRRAKPVVVVAAVGVRNAECSIGVLGADLAALVRSLKQPNAHAHHEAYQIGVTSRSVIRVAFSPDQRTIVSASDRSLKMWGERRCPLLQPLSPVADAGGLVQMRRRWSSSYRIRMPMVT
jgi:WD40 repeat protein